MRKHFYLVTEDDDPESVGAIMTTDSRRNRPTKNKEAPVHKFDEETGEFDERGKLVGMGYEDFEDEDDLDERIADVIQTKLSDIDDEWVEKAGVAEVLEA
ncbi:hypothetical protein [Haloarcula argentinensis]|uniref:Uncharacterized protein n=1 Tax=Haloarcula argentinensis TaxID=43776 RepID=A0A847U7S6_HALAR|nr:hypothetical protein [Haloarcula argentinensis]NLV14332.1 hypothetical protein [Haloarcula argentinensis]